MDQAAGQMLATVRDIAWASCGTDGSEPATEQIPTMSVPACTPQQNMQQGDTEPASAAQLSLLPTPALQPDAPAASAAPAPSCHLCRR